MNHVNLMKVAMLCATLFWGDAGFAQDGTLPFDLRVLNYDPGLNAVLLSGEFKNTLAKPMKAFRAELRLTGPAQTVRLYIEHLAKRPVLPGAVGVWNQWIRQIDPQVPEHAFLRTAEIGRLQPQLWLGRVLYADGTQQGFGAADGR